MTTMNKSLSWASALLVSLYQSGVKHAVISPGSRSTRLTLAASIHPDINTHVVLDERSAGFIALGIGKATGFPAILICTSGTAVANYYPAVIEAKQAGVPMIILSADRPPNLRNLGSSQTVDQLKIFGDQSVFFHEAGEPVDNDTDLSRIAYLGKQAVEKSLDRKGAAHINLPFRKPLEPELSFYKKLSERLSKTGTGEGFHPTVNASVITPDTSISDLLASSHQPVVIAGPSNPTDALIEQIEDISQKLSAPILAEPGSQVGDLTNSITHFDLFIRNDETRKNLKPDLIIRVGDQPFSGSLLQALETWNDAPVLHISSREQTQDHAMSITHKILCKKHDKLNLEIQQPDISKNWLETWQFHQHKAHEVLKDRLNDTKQLTDGYIFNHIAETLTDNWNVMLSNSLPVRDMLTFSKSRKNQFVNRGAAGIDGIVSTGLGIYLSSGRATCCLVGDLAFLHDSNALFTLQKVKNHPIVIVVINNEGGNIFQMLPVFRKREKAIPKEIFKSYFQTPQKVDISHLAKASGIHYRRVESKSDLEALDFHHLKRAVIIECVTDKKASMDLRMDLIKS